VELGADQARAVRSAAAAFFLTGRAQFWGSAFHLENFIETVHDVAETVQHRPRNGTVLVDVGAAPYNTKGGDITHVLTYLKHWKASSGATILGFEPGSASFSRLVKYVSDAIVGDGHAVTRSSPGEAVVPARPPAEGEWVVLKNNPASDKGGEVTVANQPGAGDNTASLETHYRSPRMRGRKVRAVTLDGELGRRGLAEREVLLLKVDVEGHEMSVLRGGMKAIAAGRVPIILLEYGDKMSPAIWDAMKSTRHGQTASAPTPQQMVGSSLYSLQRWAMELGYDTFLLGAHHHRPVMIPVSGPLWRDEYEVCRDKSSKFSRDGRVWLNHSAWNPYWSAVCWYDVALVHRKPNSPAMRRRLLQAASLPQNFCESLDRGWYPRWIDSPPPSSLCCTHVVERPQDGHVCHAFVDCARAARGPRKAHPLERDPAAARKEGGTAHHRPHSAHNVVKKQGAPVARRLPVGLSWAAGRAAGKSRGAQQQHAGHAASRP
jgi:FkbM family methyltransferase